MRATLQELRSEFSEVLGGRGVTDALLPPVVFVLVNARAGLGAAAVAGLGTAAAIIVYRLVRRRPPRMAFAGAAGTVLAVAVAVVAGRAEAFFLSGIASGALTTMAILLSIAVRRPFVAFTSALTRGWPLGWYLHPRIRPAYTRASWIWAVFFGVRTFVQTLAYRDGNAELLAVLRIVTGWPALVVLLAATYVLGRRWLRDLGGPSVDEWREGIPPPWEGQARGF